MIHQLKILRDLFQVSKNWYILPLTHFRIIPAKERMMILRNGLKLYIDYRVRTDKGLLHEIYCQKPYGTPPTGNVIDIGANIGTWTVLAAKTADRVIAIEPFPRNFNMLQRNILLNELNNVTCIEAAISRKKGKSILYFQDGHTGGQTLINEGKTAKYLEVSTIRLQDLLDAHNLNIVNTLKMDCEGSEYEILHNTSKKYLQRIKRIVAEIHKIPGKYSAKDWEKLSKYLEENGFSVTIREYGHSNIGILEAIRE